MTDVVVIGGGVIGAACAYSLAKAGKRVTILDRGRFAGGCSHGNCGYICPSHVLPHAAPGAVTSTLKTLLHRNSPLKVRPGFLLRNLSWFRHFTRRCNERDMLASAHAIQALLNPSRQMYEEMLEREAMNSEWDSAGLFFVFNTPSAFEHYAETDRLLREQFAMPAERYDRAELSVIEPALNPDAISGGYLYPSDAQLRPDVLMREWRRVLERLGVTIREQCEFTGFTTGAPHAVTAAAAVTTQGEIPANHFVIATGAWTPKLNAILGCRVPIIPGKGYSVTMPKPAHGPTHPMILEEHRVAISPFASGLRIGSTMEFAGYDESMNRSRLRLLSQVARLYLRNFSEDVVEEEWWGWRPMIYDGRPVIDRSPNFPNVILAAGHGMLGLSMAPATGQLVLELVTQAPHGIPIAAYSLKRFG